MKITWFGHSCFRIECGSNVIMVDPFLSGNPTYEGTVEAATEGVTHVILTHGHDDHIGDTVEICKSSGASLIANFEICMYLNGKGVENIDPGNHGGAFDRGDFIATFVPAWHSSGTFVDGIPVYLGNAAGVVIKDKQGGKSVYHMGDTDIFGDMALINELHAPEIGIVPIGDRFTMGANRAALACQKYFNFSAIIPCHYATFDLLDQSPDQFVAEMSGHNVVVPKVGEAHDF
ncbi:MAG: metal-dependent hydrolase [Methyloligellaceae bacterium]